MTDQRPHISGEAPTVEVRVFHHEVLVHTELCESETDAALLVEQWLEFDDVRCEVDDLTIKDRPAGEPESEPVVPAEEHYPRPE